MLCCDEKSQCQALERTQPGLPLGIGHIRTKTHDYKRHGTITLFAALNYRGEGQVDHANRIQPHPRGVAAVPQTNRPRSPQHVLEIHVIADNYATHKHAKVKAWLKKHSRFQMHFTPTGSSWMNLVERYFADLTGDCIREVSRVFKR